MRVLMVTPFPCGQEGPQGGVQSVAVTLCGAMAARKELELHVLALGRAGDTEARWERQGTSVHLVPYRQRASAFFGFSGAVRLVAAEVERLRPDIVHAQGLGPEGVAVSYVKGVPTCVTPHGDVDKDVTGNVRGVWARMQACQRRLLATRAIRRFDVAISISESRKLVGSKRVEFIPNPMNPVYFSELPMAGRSGIAVVASVKRIKRIELAISAAERLGLDPPLVVTIAGAIEDEPYSDELRRVASGCPHVKVVWAGHLEVDELMSLYDRSVGLVVASEWEISPLCVAEAMARDCPVVVPDLPGTNEMVGNGARGTVFRSGDVDDLSRAIATLVEPAKTVLLRASAARVWAAQQFDAFRIAARTEHLYRELTG